MQEKNQRLRVSRLVSGKPKNVSVNPLKYTGTSRQILKTKRRMARERRRACYSLVCSIKDIVGESFIEDDADDQQKGDRNAMSVSKQKQTKIDTNCGRPTETDSNETHTHTDTQRKIQTQTRTHTHTCTHGTQTDATRTHTHKQNTKRKTHTRTHTQRHRHTRTQRGRHIHAHTQAQTHTHTKRKTHDRHADRHQDTHSQRSHRCRGHLINPKGDEVRDLNMLLRNASRSRQL